MSFLQTFIIFVNFLSILQIYRNLQTLQKTLYFYNLVNFASLQALRFCKLQFYNFINFVALSLQTYQTLQFYNFAIL